MSAIHSAVVGARAHRRLLGRFGILAVIGSALTVGAGSRVQGQVPAPTLTDPNLQVDLVISSLTRPTNALSAPTCMAFLGPNDFFINEKATGKVKRVVNGGTPVTVLDLPVNGGSERGLLGIALHPEFPEVPKVYLYWTENNLGSLVGQDTNDVTAVGYPTPLAATASLYPPGSLQPLGNRVDCFTWNGETLVYDRNVIQLRSFQHDGNNAPASFALPGAFAGNHNGGQIRFGPDGKLYVIIGDTGRRGWMQNLPNGPFLPPGPDDEFGGPAADANHITGSVFRLNPDGTAPADNPFFTAGASIGGNVGASIQKLFSYGHRNCFALAFDPYSGSLWDAENGDDSFDEVNRVVAGGNYGWVQIMGPINRIAQFKSIEMNMYTPSATNVIGTVQQIRYPTSRIAYTPALALSRMLMLPGATYQDPEMSWRYAVPPSGLGFVEGSGLGEDYDGTLWCGEARPTDLIDGATGTFSGGFLMRFKMTGDRAHLDLSADPRLADRVADNGRFFPPPKGTPAGTIGLKFSGVESESLLIGQNFGIATDIMTGPDGALYVVSNTKNAVYRISRRAIP